MKLAPPTHRAPVAAAVGVKLRCTPAPAPRLPPPRRTPTRRLSPPRATPAPSARAMPSWDAVYAFLASEQFASTPAADAVALVAEGKAVLVDVRPADRADKCTAVGAISVPLYDKPDFSKPSFGMLLKTALLAANGVAPIELRASFADDVAAAVPADKIAFLLDETGGSLQPTVTFPIGKASRSLQAAYKLLEAGWDARRVGHVEGGLALYVAEGLPTTAPFDGKDVGRTPAGVR